MENERENLVKNLEELIQGGNAHVPFRRAVKNLPKESRNHKTSNLPYSIWDLVEHLRLAQHDILVFSTNPHYQSLHWPDDYWPKNNDYQDISDSVWEGSLDLIQKDQTAFIDLLKGLNRDLFKPFQHGTGQNLIREALLIADHNSYHTGQIILIRKLLGNWIQN